jgi:hypothetical protein
MGLLIAYAMDPGNVAFEGDSGDLSPFTGSLVTHLATPASALRRSWAWCRPTSRCRRRESKRRGTCRR